MRTLVTSSRFPHALDAIRKLGEHGHEVFAADTYDEAPGSHSRFVRERWVTPSPAFEPDAYAAAIEEIVKSRRIDLVLPCFEEAFVLARHADRIAPHAHLYCAPLGAIAQLHDKRAFVELSRGLGLRVPETRVATSRAELARACRELGEYLARPAFSRGGVVLYTNAGPLAGRVSLEDCDVAVDDPWIVQEFVRGTDVCSFSLAHHGRIVAHCCYEHPKTIEHAGGILFHSVEERESLALASAYVEALGYHGAISFDYLRTERGLVMIECNPRPTAGIFMMPSIDFVDALFAPPETPRITPPGVGRQIAVAIVRDMFRNWREIPRDLALLVAGPEDVYARPNDVMPQIYAMLSYARVHAFRRWRGRSDKKPSDLVAAQFFDLAWNGARAA